MEHDEMYGLTVDLERGYFEVKPHGFWTLDTMAAFAGELERTVRRIRATGRTPVSLCDLSDAMVQSQEVIDAFLRMMENPAVRSARVAVYTSAALTKLQAMRASQPHDEFRFFNDKDEARAWLFALGEVEIRAPAPAARESLGLRPRSG